MKYSNLLRSREFAHQLALLSTELPIDYRADSTSQGYLSHWLLTALADDGAASTPTDHFPMTTKRIRDECIKSSTKHPWFRRSPLYTSMKSILQHNLLLEKGHSVGYLLYKIIWLRFILHVSDPIAEHPDDAINVDLTTQLMAKLARRMEKLRDQYNKLRRANENVTKYKSVMQRAMDDTKSLISKLRGKVDKQIGAIQSQAVADAELAPINALDLADSSTQRVIRLRKYLAQRQMGVTNPGNSYRLNVKPVNRHYERDTAPGVAAFDAGDTADLAYFLADFEWFALYACPIEDHLIPIEELALYIDKYATSTAAIYQSNDKISISRAILTHLKLLAMLDFKVCTAHKLLEKHRPSVDMRWFDKLLLLHRVDMEAARAVEMHFRKRIAGAQYPGLLETQKINEDIFAVRFARRTKEMVELRDELLEDIGELVEELREKWQKCREDVEAMRGQADALTCQYVVQEDGEPIHVRQCYRCKLLYRVRRTMLEQFEYPLPASETEQFAVIFEFRIPDDVRILRDALHAFSKCGASEPTKKHITGDWSAHPRIGHVAEVAENQCIRIGHTFNHSTRFLHVDIEFEKFVLKNARNCVYHANGFAFGEKVSDDRLNSVCTLSVEPNSPYAGLQWMVNDTTHTQNEVLARQNECQPAMPLAEYKNFGSLRADGSRLQWRQLYAMIQSDGLSFERASVLALCLQSIWEQAPTSLQSLELQANGWLRTAHLDGQHGGFTEAMVDAVDKFLNRQRNNWMHPLKLILAAAITVRLFELNDDPDAVAAITHVFFKIRQIAIEWRGRIEGLMRTGGNSSSNEERKLRQRLILAMIAGCVTFSVHPGHRFAKQTFRKDDTCIWLQLIIILNNNKCLMECDDDEEDGCGGSEKSWLNMWMRLVQNVGIHLEPTVRDMVQQHKNLVLEYLHNEWMAANANAFQKIYFDPKCPQTMVGEVEVNGTRSYVTIDIISGLFLVDGSPVVRLPSEFDYFWEFYC